MFTVACKNLMLDACGVSYLSLHDGYPGTTGLNELSGGSPAYARQSVALAAAAAGAKASSNQPTFDVPASKTVRWIGFWSAVSGGTFLGAVPNGGTEKEFSVDVTGNKILSVAHGLVNDNRVVVYGTTVPSPLAGGTIYFVVGATTDDFQLATTLGGAAIDLTTVGTYDCVFAKIIEETFGAQGLHRVDALSLNLNG
jgi:hypothetical protein